MSAEEYLQPKLVTALASQSMRPIERLITSYARGVFRRTVLYSLIGRPPVTPQHVSHTTRTHVMLDGWKGLPSDVERCAILAARLMTYTRTAVQPLADIVLALQESLFVAAAPPELNFNWTLTTQYANSPGEIMAVTIMSTVHYLTYVGVNTAALGGTDRPGRRLDFSQEPQ